MERNRLHMHRLQTVGLKALPVPLLGMGLGLGIAPAWAGSPSTPDVTPTTTNAADTVIRVKELPKLSQTATDLASPSLTTVQTAPAIPSAVQPHITELPSSSACEFSCNPEIVLAAVQVPVVSDSPAPLVRQSVPPALPTAVPSSVMQTVAPKTLQAATKAQSEFNPDTIDVAQAIAANPTVELAQAKVDVAPEVLQQSPVLQRWQKKIPNVLEEINRDPAFRPRVRLGYSHFPSTDDQGGWAIGVEDFFIARTPLAISADYHETFDGRRTGGGADVRYYFLPLGWYVNVAPVVGYRNLSTPRYSTEGLNVGMRLMLALSRGGAADLSVTQNWVAPGTENEVGILTFSVGYALTRNIRLSADLQEQNSKFQQDTRFGVMMEWLL